VEEFRLEARAWLEENCPQSMRTPSVEGSEMSGGRKQPDLHPDAYLWMERMAERGWTVPTWPKEYGGAGLDQAHYLVLLEEMGRINARSPLAGMGVTMIGPTLLEYGSDEQKSRHLPKIASGEIRWCQGYSEPGAGSDLASLQTRAVAQGDNFIVNGSKIWTSLAQYGDWMFCLVRTDPDAAKHDGISFILFSMDSPGVTVKPIKLINDASYFCEVFFDDVVVPKIDLVHKINQGWGVAKRLLQHERSGLEALSKAGRGESRTEKTKKPNIGEFAKSSIGEKNGKISDLSLRDSIVRHRMNSKAFTLTQQRAVAESASKTPGAATSIFKAYGADLGKEQYELQLKIRGTQALGWEGEGFSQEELELTRFWLLTKASSIAGGTNEVQKNIIAKRVLGLPD
jgi:alkylation response protein AidB-like acyl-CoA dehydrogenase